MTPTQQRERDALVAAVVAAPGDEAPRLILADWLDEHGEAQDAESLRRPGAVVSVAAAGGYQWEWSPRWSLPRSGWPNVRLGPIPCRCGRQARHVTSDLYLCDPCHVEYEADPQAFLEFGPHPDGQANWQQLQAEIAADAAEPAPPAWDEIPF